ncbi:hypothetical protein B0H10DRAFT_1973397 [Mycena sp. CBHHK59/15]|nr:hypothetical protein B0H10DRAFT_1973397 [Mycena sp. CBHHK59/15]
MKGTTNFFFSQPPRFRRIAPDPPLAPTPRNEPDVKPTNTKANCDVKPTPNKPKPISKATISVTDLVEVLAPSPASKGQESKQEANALNETNIPQAENEAADFGAQVFRVPPVSDASAALSRSMAHEPRLSMTHIDSSTLVACFWEGGALTSRDLCSSLIINCSINNGRSG